MFDIHEIRDHTELEQLANQAAASDTEHWSACVHVAGNAVAHLLDNVPFGRICVCENNAGGASLDYADPWPSAEDAVAGIGAGIAVESALTGSDLESAKAACWGDIRRHGQRIAETLKEEALEDGIEQGDEIAEDHVDSVRAIALTMFHRDAPNRQLFRDACASIHAWACKLP